MKNQVGAPSAPTFLSIIKKSMKTKIYVLKDPDDNIRYVGKTGKELTKRLNRHIYDAHRSANGYKNRWIRLLLRKGIRPTIELIEEIEGNGNNEEIKYIKLYKEQGCKLTNGTTGGTDGYHINPFNVTAEEIKRMQAMGLKVITVDPIIAAERMRQQKELQRLRRNQLVCSRRRDKRRIAQWISLKRSIAATGRKHTEETKRLISEARKGKPLSEEHKRHIGLAQLGIPKGPYKLR